MRATDLHPPRDSNATESDQGALLNAALEAARAGAEVLKRYFRDPNLRVDDKGRSGLVSDADRESEETILKVLRHHFPGSGFLAEEKGGEQGTEDMLWVVDPLDGTNNFIQGLPIWCVSIGVLVDGVTQVGLVYDPLGENLFTARKGEGAYWNGQRLKTSRRGDLSGSFISLSVPSRGTPQEMKRWVDIFREIVGQCRAYRRTGSAALDLAYTAAGIYDGLLQFSLSPWDFTAGNLLVREAGGQVSDLSGLMPGLDAGSICAGGPLWETLQRLIHQHPDGSTDFSGPANGRLC